jgi:16S rRNA (uracil1498-N3)-methyltransferase
MQVGALADWKDYVAGADLPSRRFIAHPGGDQLRPMPADSVFAVGPEGGFTDEEIELARSAGWSMVGLGPRILRVETAAIAVAVLAAGNIPG